MLGSEWLYAAIALLVGVHVLTLLYAYRRQGEPMPTGDAEGAAETGRSDDGPKVVHCPHCGAGNDGGYQYCRECVSDLSAGSGYRHASRQSESY